MQSSESHIEAAGEGMVLHDGITECNALRGTSIFWDEAVFRKKRKRKIDDVVEQSGSFLYCIHYEEEAKTLNVGVELEQDNQYQVSETLRKAQERFKVMWCL